MKIVLVGDLVFLVVSVYKKPQRTWYYNFLIVSLITQNVPSLRLSQAVGYEGRHSSTLSTNHPIIKSQRWLNRHALSSLELSKPISPQYTKILNFTDGFWTNKALQD